jgi:hypothetical protein
MPLGFHVNAARDHSDRHCMLIEMTGKVAGASFRIVAVFPAKARNHEVDE